MLTAIIALHIFVSIVLIGSVLLQTGKGASIGSTFGGAGSQALFGSAGPATFLTKITAVCAFLFMATSLYLTFSGGQARTSSIMSEPPAVTAPAEDKGAPAVKPEEAAPKDDTLKKVPAVEEKMAEPAKKSAPVKEPASAKKAAPSKKASPVKEAAPAPDAE